MNSAFREIVENRIKEEGLSVLQTDRSLRALVSSTEVSFNGKKYTLTYLDANQKILYEGVVLTNDFPRLGVVTEKNSFRRYQNQYEKEKLRILKCKCHIEKDADILDWVSRQTNLQGTIKELIRKQIENERNDDET